MTKNNKSRPLKYLVTSSLCVLLASTSAYGVKPSSITVQDRDAAAKIVADHPGQSRKELYKMITSSPSLKQTFTRPNQINQALQEVMTAVNTANYRPLTVDSAQEGAGSSRLLDSSLPENDNLAASLVPNSAAPIFSFGATGQASISRILSTEIDETEESISPTTASTSGYGRDIQEEASTIRPAVFTRNPDEHRRPTGEIHARGAIPTSTEGAAVEERRRTATPPPASPALEETEYTGVPSTVEIEVLTNNSVDNHTGLLGVQGISRVNSQEEAAAVHTRTPSGGDSEYNARNRANVLDSELQFDSSSSDTGNLDTVVDNPAWCSRALGSNGANSQEQVTNGTDFSAEEALPRHNVTPAIVREGLPRQNENNGQRINNQVDAQVAAPGDGSAPINNTGRTLTFARYKRLPGNPDAGRQPGRSAHRSTGFAQPNPADAGLLPAPGNQQAGAAEVGFVEGGLRSRGFDVPAIIADDTVLGGQQVSAPAATTTASISVASRPIVSAPAVTTTASTSAASRPIASAPAVTTTASTSAASRPIASAPVVTTVAATPRQGSAVTARNTAHTLNHTWLRGRMAAILQELGARAANQDLVIECMYSAIPNFPQTENNTQRILVAYNDTIDLNDDDTEEPEPIRYADHNHQENNNEYQEGYANPANNDPLAEHNMPALQDGPDDAEYRRRFNELLDGMAAADIAMELNRAIEEREDEGRNIAIIPETEPNEYEIEYANQLENNEQGAQPDNLEEQEDVVDGEQEPRNRIRRAVPAEPAANQQNPVNDQVAAQAQATADADAQAKAKADADAKAKAAAQALADAAAAQAKAQAEAAEKEHAQNIVKMHPAVGANSIKVGVAAIQNRFGSFVEQTLVAAGDEPDSLPKGVWISGVYGNSKQGTMPNNAKYNATYFGPTIGADVNINDNNIVGIAYSYILSNYKFKDNLNRKLNAKSNVISLYSHSQINEDIIWDNILSVSFSKVKVKDLGLNPVPAHKSTENIITQLIG